MRKMDHNLLPGMASFLGEGPYTALGELAELIQRQLDPSTLYATATGVLERTLGDLLTLVVVPDHEGDGWHRESPQHVPDELQALYPQRLQLPSTLHAFWHGEPQVVLDPGQMQGSATLVRAYRQHAIAATVLVPIPVAGEARAAFLLRAVSAELFPEEVLAFLRCFAATIGMRIELHEQQQRLQQSVQEQATQHRAMCLLDSMTNLVAHASDEVLLLAETCRIACSVGGYDIAWIGLFDATARELQLAAQAAAMGRHWEPGWLSTTSRTQPMPRYLPSTADGCSRGA